MINIILVAIVYVGIILNNAFEVSVIVFTLSILASIIAVCLLVFPYVKHMC